MTEHVLKHSGTFAPDEEAPLLPSNKSSKSAVRGAWAAVWPLVLCISWLTMGVGAACYFEGWDVLTSLYVMVQIITTIGYGDITVTTPAAKVLCAFYVVGTLMLIGTILTDLVDRFVQTNQEVLRKKLRSVQATLADGVKDDEDAKKKFGNMNELLTSFFLFTVFVVIGTVFYATYESCTCGYGITKIEGCVANKCPETGGVVKSWVDSFYMSIITLTTVGFGDHSPASVVGRGLGCVWMLLGVVACGRFVSAFGQMILAKDKERKRLERVSKELFNKIDKNHDGTLSRIEFRTYALIKFGLVKEEDLDEIDQLFGAIDKDGSGQLTFAEIQEHCDS